MTLALVPIRTVAPTTLPVTLDEAKAQLGMTEPEQDWDADIIRLISAATDYLDGYSGVLGKALVTQTWRVDMAAFDDPVRLPLGPVQSISSVTYWDALNATQTVSAANYSLFVDALGAYLMPVSGAAWPTVYGRSDAIRVTFVVGYGAAAAVPDAYKHMILLLVAHWRENKEATVIGRTVATLPLGVEALLASKKNWFV